eukprot:s2932_g6.t1
MQTSTASSSSSSTNWAELLNRRHHPWPSPSTRAWDGPAPRAELHDWPGETTPGSTGRQPAPNLDDIEEDRTSCSASSVGDFDAMDEDEGSEQDDRDVHDPPSWTMKQWQDWESEAGPGEDDDGAFMQLSMSEEGELHNLGIYDEGRRELRGMLRELADLENLDEGPEGRWALRSWLVRWRHVLGVLYQHFVNLVLLHKERASWALRGDSLRFSLRWPMTLLHITKDLLRDYLKVFVYLLAQDNHVEKGAGAGMIIIGDKKEKGMARCSYRPSASRSGKDSLTMASWGRTLGSWMGGLVNLPVE